ncbi:MAG: squalene--hopene cyclase [Rubripirellula sp.]
MKRRFSTVLTTAVIAMVVVLHRPTSADEPDHQATAPSQAVSKAVDQAIPYLQRAGETWIEKRQCVSCHQVPFMLWSLSAAASNGHEIDSAQLRKWESWSTEIASFEKPERKQDLVPDATMAANIDTMNGLLLGISTKDSSRESDARDWRSQFTTALTSNQSTDGGWKACGQLPAQKRPAEETGQVTTIWTLLALAKHGVAAEDPAAAESFIENASPVSTEWWAARLLLADQRNDQETGMLRSKLLHLQQDDGGWGWLTDDPSDALATGLALYAIALTRPTVDSNSNAINAAQQFLLSTQKPDGSWAVPGTKKATRKKSTPTANYWGTAWAVIGLLES